MRLTHLFALATAAGAFSSTASAQDSRAPTENRVRTTTPRASRILNDGEPEHRAALGIAPTSTGTLRDTLGLMISSVTKGSPAEKAGLEEGNRIASINGVSLRANAADIDDSEMSSALAHRLTRELGKVKPGDEVELRVYRDGHTQTVKVKTADSDSLFGHGEVLRMSREEMDNRPVLGFGIGSTGSRRDTLGVLVMSVADSSPAAKAGIEEGNRIAAIRGVNLRVSHEDAGDRWLSDAKAQRLQREISQLNPGDTVSIRIYAEGKFRTATLKVARSGDLPRGQRGMTYFGGDGAMHGMRMMPPMPPMPAMAPRVPRPPMPMMDDMRYNMGPEIRRSVEQSLEGLRMRLEDIRPQLDRIEPRVRMELDDMRPEIDRIEPRVRMELERIRPELDRLRMEMPRLLDQVRSSRIRMVDYID